MFNNAWILFGLLSAFFASLVSIFSKLGIEGSDDTAVTLVRIFSMLILLLIAAGAMGKLSLIKAIDNRSLFFIILSSVCGVLSWLTYFIALKTGSVTRVAVLDRLSMVFVVFLAIFIGEPFCWKTFVGALLVTSGAIIITAC